MTFDGDQIDVREMNVDQDLYFVIVDLKVEKDTHVILKELNNCFPFADNDIQENAQKYLGKINKDIVRKGLGYFEAADAEKIGALMTEAQAEFDKHLQPACPSQLTAPILHRVLNYQPI